MVEAPSKGFGRLMSSCKAGGDNVVVDQHRDIRPVCQGGGCEEKRTSSLPTDAGVFLFSTPFLAVTAWRQLRSCTPWPSSSNEDGKVITSGVGKFQPHIRDQSCPCLTWLARDSRCVIIDKLGRSLVARCRISTWAPSLAEMEGILLGFWNSCKLPPMQLQEVQ